MADRTSAPISEPQPKIGPALSATSDMPEVKAAPPPISEERVPADQAAKTEADAKADPAPEAKPDAETPPAAEAKADDAPAGGEPPADQTPPWMKAEVTKQRNLRRAAEEKAKGLEARATQLAADLSKAIGALDTLTPKAAEKLARDIETQDPRPKRETFDNPDAYDTALIDWSARRASMVATAEVESKLKEAEGAKAKEAEAQANQQRNKETADAFEARKAKFVEEHADYDDIVMNDDIEISMPMAHAILNMDEGPDVAYYLGKNPDEAARIAKLNPLKAVAELGRIAQRLTTKPPVITKPAPINPLKTGSATATRKSANEESMDEYGARRAAEIRAERRKQVGLAN